MKIFCTIPERPVHIARCQISHGQTLLTTIQYRAYASPAAYCTSRAFSATHSRASFLCILHQSRDIDRLKKLMHFTHRPTAAI